MAKSNPSRRSGKAAKSAIFKPPAPFPNFPLTPTGNGYWVKSIRGKLHRFGRWGRVVDGKMQRLENDGWQEALDLFNEQKEDLYAGRTPRPRGDGVTVGRLCNRFLSHKTQQHDAGEIAWRTFQDYKACTDKLIARFGGTRLVDDLAQEDFAALRAELAAGVGPVRLSGDITRIRAVFKWGFDSGLLDKPVRYGKSFDKPSRKTLRKDKAEREIQNVRKMFSADEVKALLAKASPQLRAMILLGVNCGFGNSDCGNLPESAVDLEGSWVTFPRPKTGIARRAKLWPETVAALREAIATRPEAKDPAAAGLVFVTKRGSAWAKAKTTGNPVSAEFRKVSKQAGTDRLGVGFYGLRHSFRTIADEMRDFPAIDHIMGHARNDMASIYRESIGDDRLEAVAAHVRQWLFGKPEKPEAGDRDETTPARVKGRLGWTTEWYKGALRNKVVGEVAGEARPDWKAIKATLLELARKYDAAGRDDAA